MEQETSSTLDGEPKRNRHGGDRFTPQAKADAAKREEQIVALRLRGHTFSAIAKAVGVTKAAAQKSFMGALGRHANKELETYHRTELAALDLQQAEIWRIIAAVENRNKDKLLVPGLDQLNRIHVRRARLLGLDAPRTLNVQAIYNTERRRTKSRSTS
jgi:hypothetical protein